MDKLIIVVFVIIWAVLQARRKAIREQARRQAQSRAPQSPRTQSPTRAMQRSSAPVALGAVTSEENRALGATAFEAPVQRWAERAKAALGANEMPEEVRGLMELRRSPKPEPETDDEEQVEEIVPSASEAPYEQKLLKKRTISLGPEALRTFIVTREILGPARYRKPHRPGIGSR